LTLKHQISRHCCHIAIDVAALVSVSPAPSRLMAAQPWSRLPPERRIGSYPDVNTRRRLGEITHRDAIPAAKRRREP
jgi:hypothetical protein